MIALVVSFKIKAAHKDAFMASLFDDAKGSNEDEPGCLRFDVLQDNEDPNRIHLYEVYKDQAAVDAHRQAPHYLKWRETVSDWFDGELSRAVATPVYPTEANWR